MSACPLCECGCACDRGAHTKGKCSNVQTRHTWGLNSIQQSGPQKTKEMKRVAEATRPVESSDGLDDALRRVEAAADVDFKEEAKSLLCEIALRQAKLTSEDILEAAHATTHDNRAMGPVMLWGKRKGIITNTEPEEFVRSRFPDRNQADIRVWKSLVYGVAL